MRRWYGAGPLHLLSIVACFAVSGYAVLRLVHASAAAMILIWFAGAIVGHDLVLYPIYGLLGQALAHLQRRHRTAIAWVNYIRVPAVLSVLVLLVSFPLVFGLNRGTYRAASGRSVSPYLGRWLLLTAVVFAASGLLYAWRVMWCRREAPETGDRQL